MVPARLIPERHSGGLLWGAGGPTHLTSPVLSEMQTLCVRGSSGGVPVYELVLLQILAPLGNVSGHVEQIHHGQTGWVVLVPQGGDTTSKTQQFNIQKLQIDMYKGGELEV